jgi:hypothetical protein
MGDVSITCYNMLSRKNKQQWNRNITTMEIFGWVKLSNFECKEIDRDVSNLKDFLRKTFRKILLNFFYFFVERKFFRRLF